MRRSVKAVAGIAVTGGVVGAVVVFGLGVPAHAAERDTGFVSTQTLSCDFGGEYIGTAVVKTVKNGPDVLTTLESYKMETRNGTSDRHRANVDLAVFKKKSSFALDWWEAGVALSPDTLKQDGKSHPLGTQVAYDASGTVATRAEVRFTFDLPYAGDPDCTAPGTELSLG